LRPCQFKNLAGSGHQWGANAACEGGVLFWNNNFQIRFDRLIPLWYHTPMEIRYSLDKTALTIRIPDELHRKLKALAAKQRRSINQTVILAIEMWLKQKGKDENNI
jgi:hypothetical protein